MENMYVRVSEVELSYRPVRCARPTVTDSRAAADVFRVNWDEGQIEFREAVKVMLLNKCNHCMGICTVAQGGGASCSVDIRNVLQVALGGNAHGIILCHNHPSGSVNPSRDDDELTRKLHRGCQAVGVKLFDHVIISPDGDGYYSYMNDGKL